MPFLSKAQMKKCFATDGFGGKVDCEEWASETDFSSLPEKVTKKKIKSFKEWIERKNENEQMYRTSVDFNQPKIRINFFK